MTPAWALAAIGRPESPARWDGHRIPGRVLVTGAGGSLGSLVVSELGWMGDALLATDVDAFMSIYLDVTDRDALVEEVGEHQPGLIIHMAGAKHAPAGEEDPVTPFRVHVEGTANVLAAARSFGARVVMASTCKACDPETAYGASKLVAERLVLNAGGSVVRFYNVVETQGNVFEIWEDSVTSGNPIRVTSCRRRFMTAEEAVSLTLWACQDVPSGRYMHWPTISRSMWEVSGDVHPGYPRRKIPPRRGDRLSEPEMASSEISRLVDASVVSVFNPHDLEV